MTEEPIGLSSPIDEVSKVELLLAVARAKGSLLSSKDIDELTDLVPTGRDLRSIWKQFPALDSRYELEGILLIEKSANGTQSTGTTIDNSRERWTRAERYLEHARQFSLLSGKKWIQVLSVAGSTSYKSTSENDDVDIFCVTEKESLWIYLTKALLLARVFKLIRPRSPRFCFSCALDEEYARRLFSSPNDALFARDALTTKVLLGSSFYNSLLRRGTWLSDYFPKLHRMSTTRTAKTDEETRVSRPQLARTALNRFLFLTVGNYIRLKSTLLNRKLRKTGHSNSLFTIMSGYDHCVFESQGYQDLRRIYREFKPNSAQRHPSDPVEAESA